MAIEATAMGHNPWIPIGCRVQIITIPQDTQKEQLEFIWPDITKSHQVEWCSSRDRMVTPK
ncbi:hypothetical protein [Nitrospirillum amazonense]|uniref:hypothetical protein n=1 Tax=Nitrospirillum amazonense TaxID=28077 RepID=UPI002412CE78|nr:hypothetical protein [Nitrospirillum amazonense]MDG3444656.1 hypothetical protein [Nitrospirillum amazonense]